MSPPPRLRLHIPNLGLGGTERWALALLQGLPQFHWSVSIPPAAAGEPRSPEFDGVRVVHEGGPRGEADLVLAAWGLDTPQTAPVVSVAHATFPAYRQMMLATPRRFSAGVSQAAAAIFPAEERAQVIYNGVDLRRLAPREGRAAVRRRLGLRAEQTVIGFVGRWGKQKNPLAVARAAALIPDAVALYVSPDPGADWLAQAREAGPFVIVSPQHGDAIGDLFRAFDICMTPSLSEGFCLAAVEAWFCRTPVVGTRVGILAEHPELFTPMAAEAEGRELRRCVEQALAQRGASQVEAAYRAVAEVYTLDRMVAGWRGAILRCLSLT